MATHGTDAAASSTQNTMNRDHHHHHVTPTKTTESQVQTAPPTKRMRPSPTHEHSTAISSTPPSSSSTPAMPTTPRMAKNICVGARASATSNYRPKNHNHPHTPQRTPPEVQPHPATPRHMKMMNNSISNKNKEERRTTTPRGMAVAPPPAPTAAPSSSSDASSSENDLTEDSFLSWLVDQKNQGVGASQMLDVLGLGVSDGIAVDDDELWEAMISMGIRLIQPSIPARQKLSHVNTLHDVVDLLRNARKIVVLAGAGISVSCGIPDFRSENGIYNRLGEYNLPSPQCMFDIEFFRSNPRPFFAFAKELFPKSKGFTFVPSPSHYFLKLLEDKGKLLRIYSQNIDMLERAAGISHERSVLCHGSFETATCLACKQVYPSEAIREDVMKQQVPMCKTCNAEDGIVKPDIVFFGESLPRRFHDSIKSDENEADLVLVMGSSLKVNPVRSIVGRIHKNAPMVLINREPVGRPHKFDVELLGYSDEIVHELCRQLGWELPKPDPVLLHQSNLPESVLHACRDVPTDPLEYEFVPPCRHMFNGSKASSCSSSDDDDNEDEEEEDGNSSSNSSVPPAHMPMDEDVEIVTEDEEDVHAAASHPPQLRLSSSSQGDDHHMMVTGNIAHHVDISFESSLEPPVATPHRSAHTGSMSSKRTN